MILNFAFGNESADETNLTLQVKELLMQVENCEPERNREVRFFREPYSFRWWNSPEFAQLKKITSENWREVLDNIGDIAPSDLHQFILFRAFYALPQEEFFKCMNKIAGLCLDNVVSKFVLDGTILHYETRIGNYEPAITNMHTLARNYDNPDIAEMYRKAKIIFADDQAKIQEFEQITSGAKKKLVTSRWYYPDSGTYFYDGLFPERSWLWLIGIAIASIIIIGVMQAWRCFRKRRKGK